MFSIILSAIGAHILPAIRATMGEGPSQDVVPLESLTENPEDGSPPQGLALIAHGRLGGNKDSPPVRRLADYFRQERNLRVVTWNDRGVGRSGGGNEWSDLGVWMGDAGVGDYNRMLRGAMAQFDKDYPELKNAELFICGYSAGALSAGAARPQPSTTFSPPRYILVSYPVDLNPVLGLFRSGSYFRSVEALVQGHGWEGLPEEFQGNEPAVAGVLTITGQRETYLLYNTWKGILGSKNTRQNLTQVVVKDAGHGWDVCVDALIDEVRRWLD